MQVQPPEVQLMSYQGHAGLHMIFRNVFQYEFGVPVNELPPTTLDESDDNVWSYLSGGKDTGYAANSGSEWYGDPDTGEPDANPSYDDAWDYVLDKSGDSTYGSIDDLFWGYIVWENVDYGNSTKDNIHYNQNVDYAQTHVMIAPSAQTGIGQTILYLVEAQVVNEDTGLQLPAALVQFVNQLAGTTTEDVTNSDGLVWTEAVVSGPSGANVEITPTTPGNVSFNGMKTAKTKEDWQADVRVEINQDSGYTAVISQYLASNGFSSQNRIDIKAVYAWYQKVFLEQPTEYYWAGLAKLAGAPVYAGLSDAQNGLLTDFQQTIIQMNIDVFNDLAWQFEAYRKGGLQALEVIYASEPNALDFPAITAWRQIDNGIQQNNQALILSGNEALLSREQQQVLPPSYTLLSSFDTILMTIFAQCPVWNSANAPYPARDFNTVMSNLGYGSFNLATTSDRWTWITTPTFGIWDTWVNLSSDDKISQVSTLLVTRAVTYSTLPSSLFISQ